MKGALFLLRVIFVIITASVSYQMSSGIFNYAPFSWVNIVSIVFGSLLAVGIIWIEIHYAGRFIIGIFTVVLGLLIGFVGSYLFLQAMSLIPHIRVVKDTFSPQSMKRIDDAINVGITFFFCYLAVAILFRTRNRFKVLIPFIELNREAKEHYFILDTSIIIDGRIIALLDANILRGELIVPKFVLDELQLLADSQDKKRKGTGHRGLDMLAEFQKRPGVSIYFDQEIFPKIKDVDGKLIALAQQVHGTLITNDYNLKKIAELQQIQVINLNALANSLRPPVLPGDIISVPVIKPGESQGQGIGYMSDGTVVVIENGYKWIGSEMEIVVTNILQNNMGRMVFGKPSQK